MVLDCPAMLPAISRKETTLPLSAVSALAAAVLLAPALLPRGVPHMLHLEQTGEVGAEAALMLEVPNVDAGHAFERQYDAEDLIIHRWDRLSASAGDEEELRRIWVGGALKVSSPVKAYDCKPSTVVSLLLLAFALAIPSLELDRREAVAEEEQRHLQKVVTTTAQKPPTVMWPLQVLMLLLSGFSLVALFLVAPNATGSSVPVTDYHTDPAELAREAVFVMAHRLRWAPSTEATAAALIVATALGLAAAHVDICEEADRCDKIMAVQEQSAAE